MKFANVKLSSIVFSLFYYLICATIYQSELNCDVFCGWAYELKTFLLVGKAERKRKVRNVDDNNSDVWVQKKISNFSSPLSSLVSRIHCAWNVHIFYMEISFVLRITCRARFSSFASEFMLKCIFFLQQRVHVVHRKMPTEDNFSCDRERNHTSVSAWVVSWLV